MSRPLVTVGIPFYNEERFLALAVRSVLKQTLNNLEVILVDDGSTDTSLSIARSFDDPRITVHSDGRRRHLAARLNEITRIARGKFIARMDADDISHPDRLSRQIDLLLADERVDATGTWIGMVDENEKLFAIGEADTQPTKHSALVRGILPHATLVARREWFLAHPYDESLPRVEDRDLWCRTVGTTRFAVVPAPLYVVSVLSSEEDFLPKYVSAQKDARRLFLRYGPQSVGALATGRAWLASHARSLAMRAATAAGLTSRLVARRGRPPTAAEGALVRAAVDASRQ